MVQCMWTMKKQWVRPCGYLLIVWIFSFPWLGFAEETVYVQAEKTKIFSEAKMAAPVVTEVGRGDSLKVLETQGSWFKVERNGQTGFISKLFISKTPPVGAAQLKNVEAASEEKMSRKRGSGYTVSAATRGLQAGSRHRNNREKYRTNIKAVEAVEKQHTDTDEIKKFQESGGLNQDAEK